MAVTVSVEEFRTYYPSSKFPIFAGFDDATVQVYLDYASAYVGLDRACLRTDENRKSAIYALTAHLLYMLNLGAQGLSGPISSASEGSVSAGVAVPVVNKRSWYALSPFGMLYYQIMAPCRVGGCQFTPHKYDPWG